MKPHRFTAGGVREPQTPRVKRRAIKFAKHTTELRSDRFPSGLAVQRVADQRMTSGLGMNSNLVSSSGQEANAQQTDFTVRICCEHVVLGARVPAIWTHGHTHAISGMTANGLLPCTTSSRRSIDDRQV